MITKTKTIALRKIKKNASSKIAMIVNSKGILNFANEEGWRIAERKGI